MRLAPRSTFVTALVAIALCAPPIAGQSPAGSATLSAGAVADSLAVLKQLDIAIATNARDAASWHRRGMIAWALYERDRNKPPISGLDWTTLGRMADTSLRIAAELNPDSAHYRMMAGRFLLMSGVSITRLASFGMFEAALEAARVSGDPHVHAETAVEAGRGHWRRYDAFANRILDVGEGDCGTSARANGVTAAARDSAGVRRVTQIEDEMRKCSVNLGSSKGFSGEADYIQAEALFREAFEAEPSFERAYRQFAMLLVERNRWSELHAIARARIKATPDDAWAWLTVGLALHRMKNPSKATADALERGLSLLTPYDRARLDHLERVIRPDDTTKYQNLAPATRAAMQQLYWKNADPLWSRDGNESRSEFLARVVYSELRWTVEEMKVLGAQTDRADVHIRYGPPDFITAARRQTPTIVDAIFTTWSYNAGFSFQFVGAPTFATARFNPETAADQIDFIRGTPVRMDNIRSMGIDTMPVQFVRFRATSDSVDVMLSTLPPVQAIRRVAEVAGKVRTDFWLLRGGIEEIAHDSAMIDSAGIRTYTKRIPAGTYLYRAEASADASLYAARATAAFVAGLDSIGFATRGFGMSDLLIASRAASRGTPVRWTDLDVRPLVGTVARQGVVAMVWENYELADDRGSARYGLAVSIERQRSLVGRIVATVVRGVGSAVGVDRAEDRVTIRYERTVRYADVLVDNVDLALGSTPPGNYLIRVEITDRVTGRVASRTIPLRIAESR